MNDAESRLRNLQRQAAWLPPRKLAPVIDLAAYRRQRVIQLVRKVS